MGSSRTWLARTWSLIARAALHAGRPAQRGRGAVRDLVAMAWITAPRKATIMVIEAARPGALIGRCRSSGLVLFSRLLPTGVGVMLDAGFDGLTRRAWPGRALHAVIMWSGNVGPHAGVRVGVVIGRRRPAGDLRRAAASRQCGSAAPESASCVRARPRLAGRTPRRYEHHDSVHADAATTTGSESIDEPLDMDRLGLVSMYSCLVDRVCAERCGGGRCGRARRLCRERSGEPRTATSRTLTRSSSGSSSCWLAASPRPPRPPARRARRGG